MKTKKKVIKLTESDLHNLVEGAVKQILKERKGDVAYAAYSANPKYKGSPNNSAAYQAYHKNRKLFDRVIEDLDGIKDFYERNLARNPRISKSYENDFFQKIEDLKKMLDEDSPLFIMYSNQMNNRYNKRKNGKIEPFKPYNDDDDIEEPEDWYERNAHGDFDRFY